MLIILFKSTRALTNFVKMTFWEIMSKNRIIPVIMVIILLLVFWVTIKTIGYKAICRNLVIVLYCMTKRLYEDIKFTLYTLVKILIKVYRENRKAFLEAEVTPWKREALSILITALVLMVII